MGAAALAGFMGLLTGDLWIAEALVLTVAALAIVFDSLRKAESRPATAVDAPNPRSRIEHYYQLTKVKDSSRLAKTADNPFERNLLALRGWSGITDAELVNLAKTAS